MSGRPFLILQARPETDAADQEYAALLDKAGLVAAETLRVRLDREDLPRGFRLDGVAGVIVGGGPACLSDPANTKSPQDARIEAGVLGLLPEICARDHPFMGCCYGIGALAHHLGAEVSKRRWNEAVGTSACRLTEAGRDDPILAGFPDAFDAFVGHKEAVQALPRDCVHLITSDRCRFQMIRHRSHVYATQFHPEADGEVFARRVVTYRDHGYFPRSEADALMAFARAQDTPWPPRVLAAFVSRYRDRAAAGRARSAPPPRPPA